MLDYLLRVCSLCKTIYSEVKVYSQATLAHTASLSPWVLGRVWYAM